MPVRRLEFFGLLRVFLLESSRHRQHLDVLGLTTRVLIVSMVLLSSEELLSANPIFPSS